MPTNTPNKDFRTIAYVLRRTNYGEADRILNLITPSGKISVIAKGVRKEKSKIAGGIEMFCRVELGIHQGKSEFGIVTSSKLLKYYGNIITDLQKLEFASFILKTIHSAAEISDNHHFFNIVDQVLPALNNNYFLPLIEAWFWFNLAKANGEQVNLYRDCAGQKLDADKTYTWDSTESALKEDNNGKISANEIKFMRLLLSSSLELASRVQNINEKLPEILYIAKCINKVKSHL